MMLGDSVAGSDGDAAAAAGPPPQSRITLDDLFVRAATRRPDALALIDAPNRESFTDGAPRQLSYAEADRMVSAIAGRLRQMGLPTDAVIGIQLPNTVENVLTLLGVLRAGMIAAPLPLLWRRADTIAALTRVGAKALITCRSVSNFEHGLFATRVAADVFSIRYVGGFGSDLPDGVVPFDDLFSAARVDPVPPLGRDHDAGAHLAVVSFEIGQDGPLPVARRHLELLAGGLAVFAEGRIDQGAAILSTVVPSTFAGICLTVMPWLLAGGTLVLQQPFDTDVFVRQRRRHDCSTVVLPAPVAFRLAELGLFDADGDLTILAPWRAPERFCESPPWRERRATLVDVAIFGEAGLVASRRGVGGRPLPLPLGPVTAPRDGGATVIELGATAEETLALRGPMVPRHMFPPGIEETDQPYFPIDRGVVDTGYCCRVDRVTKAVMVTGSPAGIINVGGYSFALRHLLQTIWQIDVSASLVALPDTLVGQRLVGIASDPEAMRAGLHAAGLNPLVAAAFSERDAPRLTLAVA